jgi:hypothetical protein
MDRRVMRLRIAKGSLRGISVGCEGGDGYCL